MDKTLLLKSLSDYNVSVYLMRSPLPLEDKIDHCLFHLEQAIEKALKFYLRYKGVTYMKIPDIQKLLQLCESNGLPKFGIIEQNVDDITDWGIKPRYNFYHIEDINIYYLVIYGYCQLYNYLSKLEGIV